MEQRGKPVTTSVPSISIKFHANAEHIEELYGGSDDEHGGSDVSVGPAGTSEPESSPLKYLPRLVKRSTSIDITPNTSIDASPPSDPWRFFSDIKGKITKSVEEKITEIKARNQEEGSPLKGRTVKDSKDNSSVSDSEDLSESSISKTCGIVSTTEGAEMSSDDDTPSIEKDKKTEDRAKIIVSSGLRHRFRLLKPKSNATREGTINKRGLVSLYNINSDKIEQALPEENEVESAVDALEDTNLGDDSFINDEVLKGIEQQFDNIKIDNDNVISVKEVNGGDVGAHTPKTTVYAPVGFVDFRTKSPSVQQTTLMPVVTLVLFGTIYVIIQRHSSYLAGFMLGVCVTLLFYYVRYLLDTPTNTAVPVRTAPEIVQVQAVKEFQPLTKYEGWVNELPDTYNPNTYHISQTQSVFLRLQGNLLRVSHTRTKVPKRALWNEPKIKPSFTHHRVYNLVGAKIELLPDGLAKKRHWSKKYPICVTLNKDQMDFEPVPPATPTTAKPGDDDEEESGGPKTKFQFGNDKKKKKKTTQALRYSQLTEENEERESESRTSTPSQDSPEGTDDHIDEEMRNALDEALRANFSDTTTYDEEFEALTDDWGHLTVADEDSPTQTRLYLFGRTDREKEDWFRRLKAATHANELTGDKTEFEMDYLKFMMILNKASLCSGVEYPNQIKGKKKNPDSSDSSEELISGDVQWVNGLLGRVLFDCLRDDTFTQRIKDKIQRKLSSIKLPYFIEGLTVTELSLGHNPPLIHRAFKPVIDERGLWIDLDVTFEGLVILILQTKLNLMKLKQPPQDCSTKEKSAMFNSDLEDSAESSSDEEGMSMFQQAPVLDSSGLPVQGVGGSSTTSKKFMKMVDRIAESKFFQAATEYRYIKKAMEGVSNTELRLRVEVKELVGTLVLNIPTPPSDRIWIGFRPTPDLALSAQPIVGERNITFLRVTSWIEKKLLLEFQKLMVIPNMEDFIVPVMSPKLPE